MERSHPLKLFLSLCSIVGYVTIIAPRRAVWWWCAGVLLFIFEFVMLDARKKDIIS